jgi:hypothetical protein
MKTSTEFNKNKLASTIKTLVASGAIGLVSLSNPATAEIYDNILFYSAATDLYMNASIGGDYSIHLDSNNATYANGGGYLYVGDTGSVLDNGVTLIGDNDGAGEGAIWLGNGSDQDNVVIRGDGDIFNRSGAITIETVSVSGSSIYNSGGALSIEGMTFSGTTGINTGSRAIATGANLEVGGYIFNSDTGEAVTITDAQGLHVTTGTTNLDGNLEVQGTISSGDSGALTLSDGDGIRLTDGAGGELSIGLGGTYITDCTFSVNDGSFVLRNITTDGNASSLYDIDGINMSAGNTASVNILPDDVDIDADNNVTIDADNTIAVTAVSSTTVSGGGSTLTMDATGASLNTSLDMGGYQITNLSNGVLDSDAATMGQLNAATGALDDRIDGVEDAAFSGIAMSTALNMIPDPQPGQTYSLGVGYGTYKGHDAFAAGFTGHLNSRTTLKAGFGRSNSETTAGVGIGFGW